MPRISMTPPPPRHPNTRAHTHKHTLTASTTKGYLQVARCRLVCELSFSAEVRSLPPRVVHQKLSNWPLISRLINDAHLRPRVVGLFLFCFFFLRSIHSYVLPLSPAV